MWVHKKEISYWICTDSTTSHTISYVGRLKVACKTQVVGVTCWNRLWFDVSNTVVPTLIWQWFPTCCVDDCKDGTTKGIEEGCRLGTVNRPIWLLYDLPHDMVFIRWWFDCGDDVCGCAGLTMIMAAQSEPLAWVLYDCCVIHHMAGHSNSTAKDLIVHSASSRFWLLHTLAFYLASATCCFKTFWNQRGM